MIYSFITEVTLPMPCLGVAISYSNVEKYELYSEIFKIPCFENIKVNNKADV